MIIVSSNTKWAGAHDKRLGLFFVEPTLSLCRPPLKGLLFLVNYYVKFDYIDLVLCPIFNISYLYRVVLHFDFYLAKKMDLFTPHQIIPLSNRPFLSNLLGNLRLEKKGFAFKSVFQKVGA